MNTEARKYYDVSGTPCSLNWLVRNEPEWAANQIRHRDSLAAEVERLQAENEKLRGWVKDAYDEGYVDGDSTRVTGDWAYSLARARLEGRAE